MKQYQCFLFIAFLLLVQLQVEAQRKLVWSDEFNDTGLPGSTK